MTAGSRGSPALASSILAHIPAWGWERRQTNTEITVAIGNDTASTGNKLQRRCKQLLLIAVVCDVSMLLNHLSGIQVFVVLRVRSVTRRRRRFVLRSGTVHEVKEAGLFVGTGLLLLLAVSLSPDLREELGRLTVNMFVVFDNAFGDYNGSRNDMRHPNLEFEGHIESTKSHLSTFIVPRCRLLLLFFEQHSFRSLTLWRRRL